MRGMARLPLDLESVRGPAADEASGALSCGLDGSEMPPRAQLGLLAVPVGAEGVAFSLLLLGLVEVVAHGGLGIRVDDLVELRVLLAEVLPAGHPVFEFEVADLGVFQPA